MTSDSAMLIVRYLLLAVGASLTSHGVATDAGVNEAIGAIMTLSTFVWGVYVHWNTKAVPASTAARTDVPTINPVTGAPQAGNVYRG